MKPLYCIALEGNGPTGVDWYFYKQDRDAAVGKTVAESEVVFDIMVPDWALGEAVTKLADEAAWNKVWLDDPQVQRDTTRRMLEESGKLAADAARWTAWSEAIAALDDSNTLPPMFAFFEKNFSHMKANVTVEQVNAVTDAYLASVKA